MLWYGSVWCGSVMINGWALHKGSITAVEYECGGIDVCACGVDV